MNTNKQKNYLVIKNVCLDKNLKEYLEQICSDEKVSILYEEFNQFDIWNQKQSVYSEFNASPSSDILLWSYESCKLDYVNYLYSDFEQRYRNAGHVVNRIIESVNNEENLDEGEKLDIAIRDDLSSGIPSWSYTFKNNYTQIRPEIKENAINFGIDFSKYLQHDLDEGQKDSLRKNLGTWATGDWKVDIPKKQPTFKQKVSNFYNKNAEKIMYFCAGIFVSNIFFLTLLTIKNIMVK